VFWHWRIKLKWASFEFFAPSLLLWIRSWIHSFKTTLNKKQCKMTGLFMSLVIHYWIGDVQDSQGAFFPKTQTKLQLLRAWYSLIVLKVPLNFNFLATMCIPPTTLVIQYQPTHTQVGRQVKSRSYRHRGQTDSVHRCCYCRIWVVLVKWCYYHTSESRSHQRRRHPSKWTVLLRLCPCRRNTIVCWCCFLVCCLSSRSPQQSAHTSTRWEFATNWL